MRKFLFFLMAALLILAVAGCGSEAAAPSKEEVKTTVEETPKKILIAYFSHSGHTERIARQIQAQTGGDIFHIETVRAYPEEYHACTEAAKAEKENNARPELKRAVENMATYDVIFIGYPIWWHTAPMAVYSFLESYDLSGKTVIPFCTSGGSDLDESMPAIRQLCAKATLLEGLTANNAADVAPWLQKIGFGK